jgi:hypothetical protein
VSGLKTLLRKEVGIKVNNDIGHYFQSRKGLRQGNPLSPILFNIVADMLAIMIARAKEDGQVDGLIPHLVDGGTGGKRGFYPPPLVPKLFGPGLKGALVPVRASRIRSSPSPGS